MSPSAADAARRAARPLTATRPPWWAMRPTLSLLLYPERDHIRLTLRYNWRDMKGQGHSELLLAADWAPAEVTEERTVRWASRALAKYLEGAQPDDE